MDLHLDGKLFSYDPENPPSIKGSIVYNSDRDSVRSSEPRGQNHCDRFLDLDMPASSSSKRPAPPPPNSLAQQHDAMTKEEETLLRSHPVKRKTRIPDIPTQNIRYGAAWSTSILEESDDLNAARIISEGVYEPEMTVLRVEADSIQSSSRFKTKGYANVIETPEGSDAEESLAEESEVKNFFKASKYYL